MTVAAGVGLVEVNQVLVVGTAVAGSLGSGAVLGDAPAGDVSGGDASAVNRDPATRTAPTPRASEDDADLTVFADRLAAAGTDRATLAAQAHIRRSIEAGVPPPGLRRLAEALAASVTDPPQPRNSAEDAACVVTAMRGHALVVLTDVDDTAVAGAVAALVTDGRRVIVTGSTPAELGTVRAVMPADVVDRVLDRLPALPSSELRELRRLVATSTPAARSRRGQQLPPPEALPGREQVTQLCSQTGRSAGSAVVAGMVPRLLGDLEPDRRAAVTAVARLVIRALGALYPRVERDWAWPLLSHLIYGRQRAAFDRLLEDTAQAVGGLDRARQAPSVAVTGPLVADAVDILRRYRDFLSTGGRSRAYFRSPAQRDVQPVLRVVRVAGRAPQTAEEIDRVIDHMELAERLARVDVGCAEIAVPPPHNEAELRALSERLLKVASAARSVGALRHDVLFIAADSPLSVPDIDTAEQVARAILDFAEHGSAPDSGLRLDRMAEEIAALAPPSATAPEHRIAVAALRARDFTGYAQALDALEAARREGQDENRRTALERRLAAGSPRLAEAWRTLGEQNPAVLGLACFVPSDALLSAMPPQDTADVVVVLGAAQLGVERLLLTAVAPRMIATVAPGERPEEAPTLLSVLQRASALVVHGWSGSPGPVVRLVEVNQPGALADPVATEHAAGS